MNGALEAENQRLQEALRAADVICRKYEAEIDQQRNALYGLDGFVRWIEEHYPRALREMPSGTYRAVHLARAALGTAHDREERIGW